MSAIGLRRGTGQDDLEPCHYLTDPMTGFSIQRSLRRPLNLKGHLIYLTKFLKFLGCEFHTIITCVPSLEVVKHTLKGVFFKKYIYSHVHTLFGYAQFYKLML
jgi:hypothetical protein